MADFQDLAIERALQISLGRSAVFWYYGRQNRTPMTSVLEEVERQIGPRFAVYWVEDDGPPEVFCLPGFSPTPVVFSTRYLSLTAFFRDLFVVPLEGEFLVDVSERTTLKVLAEMALRHGEPDYAVLAFTKSMIGKGIWLDDGNRVPALERETVNEAYMATWFYGLLHELGHLNRDQIQSSFFDGVMFSEAGIIDTITKAVDSFTEYPDAQKHKAVETAKQRRSESVLGIDQLRDEVLADLFATSVLFKTTFDIMREIEGERFEVARLIQEIFIFLNITAIIDRCRRVAKIASGEAADYEAGFENLLLPPVAVMVRGMKLRYHLLKEVTSYLFGDNPTSEDFERVDHLIDEINSHLVDKIELVESGLARAMRFSLFPDERENDWALLEEFRKGLSPDQAGSLLSLLEAQRFCKMADSLGKDGKLLQALKGIVKDPNRPVNPDPVGDHVYFVPWVEGPDGFEQPFSLETKHGRLVFVFLVQDEIYEIFLKSSEAVLKPGFSLKRAVLAVPRRERLGPELSAHIPEGEFGIILQGTDLFEQYMKELGEDSIWKD